MPGVEMIADGHMWMSSVVAEVDTQDPSQRLEGGLSNRNIPC